MDLDWYQPVPCIVRRHHASVQLQTNRNLFIHLRSHQYVKTMLIKLLIDNNIDQIHRIQQRLQFSTNFEWYTLADITV
jgi:hypothetical protein